MLSRSRRHQVCVSRRPRTNKLRTERDSVEGRRKEVESNGVYWEKFESRGVGERLPKVFGVSNERRRFLAKKSVLMYKEDYHYYSLRPRACARESGAETERRDLVKETGNRSRRCSFLTPKSATRSSSFMNTIIIIIIIIIITIVLVPACPRPWSFSSLKSSDELI